MMKRCASVFVLAAGLLFIASQTGCATAKGGKKSAKQKPAQTKAVAAKPAEVKPPEAPKNRQLEKELTKARGDMALREAAIRRDGAEVVVAKIAYDEAKKNFPENLRKQVKAGQDGEARIQDLDAKKKASEDAYKKVSDLRKALDSDAEVAELKKKADEAKAASYAAAAAYTAKKLEKENANNELTAAKKGLDEAKKGLADAEKAAYEPAVKESLDKDAEMQKMRARITEIEKELGGGAAATQAKPAEKVEPKPAEKPEVKPAEKVEATPEAKPAEKVEAKPPETPEAKPAEKVEPKAEEKPAAKPE